MIAPVFVDTNVIVYRFDTTDPRKQSHAVDWFTLLWNRRSGRVSFQMLQDAYAALTRKLKPTMAAADAQRMVRGFPHGSRWCWNSRFWSEPSLRRNAICSLGGMLSSSPPRGRADATS